MIDLRIKTKQRVASRRPAFNFDIARCYAEHATANEGLNRLKDAWFSSMRRNPCLSFSERMSYDKHGNILTLYREGYTAESNECSSHPIPPVNWLQMAYRGNQLLTATDTGEPYYGYGSQHFKDQAHLPEEYLYDKNGNLVVDYNKRIAKIEYNYLNLPDRLQMAEGHLVSYGYDALGVKRWVLNTTARPGLLIAMGSLNSLPMQDILQLDHEDYCGNFRYRNGTLTLVNTPEGYVRRNVGNNTWEYTYYVRDHLGSVRCEVSEQGAIKKRTDYYPFGMEFGENPFMALSEKERFTGKELEDQHGLNVYDFLARRYDMAIPRFTTPDPLAEKYYSVSPYAYCGNNPVNAIDPDGKKIIFVNGYLGFGSPEGGKAYWNRSFIAGAQSFFNDKSAPHYTNVNHGLLSIASWRHYKGYNYAKENYASITDGMNKDETFKLISHSMGGAFSAGMEEYLREQGWTIESSVFINTYQSNDVKNPESATFVVDYQNTNDPVLFWFDANLGLGKIKNSDIQIRVRSDEKTEYIHRSPIDSGKDFWNELQKKINEILNEDN